MQRRKLARRAWVVLFVAACAVYFYGLGAMPLVGPDEPRYAQVAREMYARGDLVTPTLGGHTWFEKPALLYWLMIAAYALFGVTEFAARIGPALSGLLGVALVGWTARRVEREAGADAGPLGLASAAVFASCAGLLVFSRGASFDIVLTFTVTLALACFFVADLEKDARRRQLLLAAFYAGVGLSLLAKGLVGIVLPAGIVLFYFALRRKWPNPLTLGIVWGAPLMFAVAALWYGPVIWRHGAVFVEEFFVQHHFARYVSNKYNHPQPIYFYLPIMALLSLPWTLFVAGGVGKFWRRNFRADDAEGRLYTFALAWLIFPVAFFSLSGSKLPGYVLPALPGAALLAGLRVARFARGGDGTVLVRATGALALFLSVTGGVYGYFTGAVPVSCVVGVTAPAAEAGVVALVWAERRRGLCVASLVGATFLTVTLIISCALENFARRESVRDLLRAADAEGYSVTLPVYQLHVVERTAEFYAAGRLVYRDDGEPHAFQGPGEVVEALRARGAGAGALVLVPREYQSQLTGATDLESRVIGDNGANALVFVRVN